MKIIKSMKYVLIMILLLLAGCNEPKEIPANQQISMQKIEPFQPGSPVPDSGLPVLKSYSVPDKHAKEVSYLLNDLLSGSKIGNARIAPDGQILVLAIGSYHKGIEEFIDRFNKNNPDVAPSVEVNYWIVAGKKADAPAKLDEFSTIKSALETIQKKQGNMEFKLLDKVATTSSGQGTRSNYAGVFVSIGQEISVYNDGTLIIHPNIVCHTDTRKIQNNLNPNSFLDTQIVTKSGEIVILGQLSQKLIGKPVFKTNKPGDDQVELVDVYYIITTELKK